VGGQGAGRARGAGAGGRRSPACRGGGRRAGGARPRGRCERRREASGDDYTTCRFRCLTARHAPLDESFQKAGAVVPVRTLGTPSTLRKSFAERPDPCRERFRCAGRAVGAGRARQVRPHDQFRGSAVGSSRRGAGVGRPGRGRRTRRRPCGGRSGRRAVPSTRAAPRWWRCSSPTTPPASGPRGRRRSARAGRWRTTRVSRVMTKKPSSAAASAAHRLTSHRAGRQYGLQGAGPNGLRSA
jgi:hypothetical protein